MFSQHVYKCAIAALGGQKRESDPLALDLKDSCELPCGCYDPNQGHLQGQPMLLVTEASLQMYFL